MQADASRLIRGQGRIGRSGKSLRPAAPRGRLHSGVCPCPAGAAREKGGSMSSLQVGRPVLVRGVLFSLALVIPIALGFFFQAFPLVSSGALGAMFALLIDPKRGLLLRVIAIGAGGALVVAAAALGVLVHGHHWLSLALLFLLSWLAAQPKPEHAYLGLLVKYAAVAVLLASFGFHASWDLAFAFLGGITLGICLSLVGMLYEEKDDGGSEPLDEFRAVLHGDTNDRLFGLAVPVTVLAATLTARYFAFGHPAWVGLTVLFVMHTDGATELHHIRDRVLGTFLGVLASSALLYSTTSLLAITFGVAVSAFLIPVAGKTRYMAFSFAITCAVLLLIDIAMFLQGGDFNLLRWRLIDTVSACVWVLASNLVVRLIQKRPRRQAGAPGNSAPAADPASATDPGQKQ